MENEEVPEFFQERDLFGLEKPKVNLSENENIPNSEHADISQEDVIYASLGSRTVAYLIDSLILYFPVVLLDIVVWGSEYTRSDHQLGRIVVGLLVWSLYYGVMESSSGQATFGKKFLGLKVTDENGGRLTFKNAALRYIYVLFVIIPFCIGVWVMYKDEKTQGWHDKMVGALVIRKK
ncbi:MAG TPA: RDD family protein [Bacteroidia bacterium]|jgi:uncharacterized RDD family membrane protein YckC|nr:RDD family protein [Bacteroidia bacterium]